MPANIAILVRTVQRGAVAAVCCAVAACWTPARGDTVHVAVASNFLEPMETLAERFGALHGHRLRVSGGSTGMLYTQVVNGAPYDVLLAADQERPEALEDNGLAVPGSRFTYAIGRLTVWSATVAVGPDTLAAGNFRHLAIANPRLAPYGLAARQCLEALGLWPVLRDRLVLGQNINQAFQFVVTGNAEVGFVALSQVLALGGRAAGNRWDVPSSMHDPIHQDAVLLRRGAGSAAARALLDFLRSEEARALITAAGYAVPAP